MTRWQRVPIGLAASIAAASGFLCAAMVGAGLDRMLGLGAWLVADVLLVVALHALVLALPLAIRGALRGWRGGWLGPAAGFAIGAVPFGAALAVIGIGTRSDALLAFELAGSTGVAGALGGCAYAAVWRQAG